MTLTAEDPTKVWQPDCALQGQLPVQAPIPLAVPRPGTLLAASRGCSHFAEQAAAVMPSVDAGTPEGRVEEEFSKVFRPDGCSLDMLDPARFDGLLAGRRLIMFGDSIMRIQWLSLACMLRSQVRTRLCLESSFEHEELSALTDAFGLEVCQ